MEIGNSFLVQHFSDSVWLIHPERLKTISEVILNKVLYDMNGSLNLLQAEPKEKTNSFVQRYRDVAILNIEGTMVPKCSWLDSLCGFVSTLALNNAFNDLVADNSVSRIVLYFDSPGGVSTGIPEFAESIFQARSKKEIVSFTDTCACSAAYWLFSAADQAVATPSSTIGSIGTYISLIKEKSEGKSYDVHIIQAGDNKLFGSPDTPLTEEELNYFSDKVQLNYDLFTQAVAAFRNVDVEEVVDTDASYYDAMNAPEWMYDALADANYVLS